MTESSPQPRYTLTYGASDPQTTVHCDTLPDCMTHMRSKFSLREGIVPVYIRDHETRKRGRVFPSGRIRWNG